MKEKSLLCFLSPKAGCCNFARGDEAEASWGMGNFAVADQALATGGFLNLSSKKNAKINDCPNCFNWAHAENSQALICCNYVSGKNSTAAYCCSLVSGEYSAAENLCSYVPADSIKLVGSNFVIVLEKFSIYPEEGLCCSIASSDGTTYCCSPHKHELIVKKFKRAPIEKNTPEQEKMTDEKRP